MDPCLLRDDGEAKSLCLQGEDDTVFTGIVKDVGQIRDVEGLSGEGRRLTIASEALTNWRENRSLEPGSSVAVDGVCVTATAFDEDAFRVDLSGETLERTTLTGRRESDRVNLEPSLRVGDEVGGHFVLGHVDDTAKVVELENRGDFYHLAVEVPSGYGRYLAPKGCVALDGISLTINELSHGTIRIRIVPHTYQKTALSDREPGDVMNLEVDMLARYIYHNSGYVGQNSESVRPPDGSTEGPSDPSGPDASLS